MHSGQIIALLRQKHSEDVFVEECKDGPTQTSNHLRLDAWVMKKSWSNSCAIGYEVKVNRSDFVNDRKWPNYLPLCNELYFVCPSDLIQPEELPQDVGLYWVAKNATNIRIKRKAAYRDVQIPVKLYQYILMCRVHIKKGQNCLAETKKDYWAQWLIDQKLDADFGYRVSRSIKTRIEQEITKVHEEKEQALNLVKAVEDTIAMFKSNGIDITSLSGWSRRGLINRKIQGINGHLPDGLERTLLNAESQLKYIRESLAKIQKGEGYEES